MGKPLSVDLRNRIRSFVEAGYSRRAAAEHFDVSPSAVIKLMALVGASGSGERCTTNAIERLHEEFKRRIKTQCALPNAETAAMLSRHGRGGPGAAASLRRSPVS